MGHAPQAEEQWHEGCRVTGPFNGVGIVPQIEEQWHEGC